MKQYQSKSEKGALNHCAVLRFADINKNDSFKIQKCLPETVQDCDLWFKEHFRQASTQQSTLQNIRNALMRLPAKIAILYRFWKTFLNYEAAASASTSCNKVDMIIDYFWEKSHLQRQQLLEFEKPSPVNQRNSEQNSDQRRTKFASIQSWLGSKKQRHLITPPV